MSDDNGNGRRRVAYQPTITLGNILTMLAIVSGMAVAFFDMRTTVAVVQNEISHVKASIARLEKAIAANWRYGP